MKNESPSAWVNGTSDNLLYSIFDNLSAGLELYNSDGYLIEINHTQLKLMGVNDKKDILGQYLFDNPGISADIEEQIRKGETVHFMAKYNFDLLGNSFHTYLVGIRFFDVTVSSIRNEEGDIANYMMNTQDITDRISWQRKYEDLYAETVYSKKELHKSEQRLMKLIRHNELVLNNTNSGLAYIANDYIVQWENISLCSRSLSYEAYKKGELCYKTAHNRSTPCDNCVMQRARKSGQVESIKFTLNNGHTIEVFATPVYNSLGEIDGVVIRVDDVSERENMIHELEQARSRAEQSDRLKSAFLANMSHEIRTPLNAIVGFSDLLAVTEDQEDRLEYSRIINTNNELLLKLINDILDLSKIEAGSVDLKYEEFDLAIFFNELAVALQRRITNPDVRLKVVNPYTNYMVILDKSRFAQVVTNFVTNAIKYTPEGTIEMGYEELDEGMGIRIYVRDTGIGIQEDKKNKVFNRFEKLDEFAQGTGLGLSICKAIVEACGGSVGFESEYGVGSLFWAVVPCENGIMGKKLSFSQQKSRRRYTHIFTKRNKGAQKIILVAEDVQSNFSLVSSLLRNRCKLLHAANGQEAVDIVRNEPVDLVLMDMKMPLMDGRIATAEIRKFNTHIPIIALTAHAFDSDRVAALEAGCDDYLVKPINGAKLIQVLKEYLS